MTKQQKHRNSLLSQQGFSLVELGVVMLISGTLMGFGLQAYNNFKVGQKRISTIESIELSQEALGEFFSKKGRLPCPADPSLAPDDPNYGREDCRPKQDLVANPTAFGGQCPLIADNPKCVQGARGDVDGNGFPDPVIIGILPYKDILDVITTADFVAENSMDGYGMRLTYAVSEALTDPDADIINQVDTNLGVIDVRDENDISNIFPEKTAQYVVLSHGINRIGAWTPEGERVDGCNIILIAGEPPVSFDDIPIGQNNISAGNVALDKENCDRNDAIFARALTSLADTNDYFDDILGYKVVNNALPWRFSLVGPGVLYNTNPGNVGVGTQEPDATLHVQGSIRAEDRAEAEYGFCNTAVAPKPRGAVNPGKLSPGCVDVERLLQQRCPEGQAAVGIDDNQLQCADIFDPSAGPIQFDCLSAGKGYSAGAFVTGFSVENGVITDIRCAEP